MFHSLIIIVTSVLVCHQGRTFHNYKRRDIYMCESGLPEEWSTMYADLKIINCEFEIETAYYSAPKHLKLKPICKYCGSSEDLLPDDEEPIKSKKEKGNIIYPVCKPCYDRGKTVPSRKTPKKSSAKGKAPDAFNKISIALA